MEFIEQGNDLVFTDKTESRKIEITIVNGIIWKHISGKIRICDDGGCEISNFYLSGDRDIVMEQCKEIYESWLKYLATKEKKFEFINIEDFGKYLYPLYDIVKGDIELIINCACKVNRELFKAIPFKSIHTNLTQDKSLYLTFNNTDFRFVLEVYYIVEEGEAEAVVTAYKNEETVLLQYGSFDFIVNEIKKLLL